MDQRSKYVEKLSAQMVEWDAQIDRLRVELQNAVAKKKFEYSGALAALQLKRDQAAEKLQGIAMATDDDWEDMKDGAEQIWDEIKELFSNAIDKKR